ncbi:unnamed protein product [Didymodactylos carnosus]|uniref:NHL repeat containing protein n=1 Tax=Didymodactylos carnosus TaxID=1234261 RepID=A0A813TIH1_9BILA|nr:unnamed protein product [Didymodactylos carnosus]CAF3600273.1 unnamed protein product [Didymodactylos carnosus]
MPLTTTPTATAAEAAVATTTTTKTTLQATWYSNIITVAGGNGAGSLQNQLNSPAGISADSEGNLIVTDYGNERIQMFFNNGTIANAIVTGGSPINVFFDKFGSTYSASRGGSSALSNGYIDRNGSIYVADTENNRVMKWVVNANQGIVVAGGSLGFLAVGLWYPSGVYVDELKKIGAVYVSDTMNNRIQKWSPPNHPVGLIYDANTNYLYIADADNNRILKWSPYSSTGQIIATGLSRPTGISFDSNWNLYVSDYNNNRVQKFLYNPSSCPNGR